MVVTAQQQADHGAPRIMPQLLHNKLHPNGKINDNHYKYNFGRFGVCIAPHSARQTIECRIHARAYDVPVVLGDMGEVCPLADGIVEHERVNEVVRVTGAQVVVVVQLCYSGGDFPNLVALQAQPRLEQMPTIRQNDGLSKELPKGSSVRSLACSTPHFASVEMHLKKMKGERRSAQHTCEFAETSKAVQKG